MWPNLENKTSRLLERCMDGSALRARVLAQNVANANTPHYKRQDVDFSAIFAGAFSVGDELPLTITHPRHLPSLNPAPGQPGITKETKTETRFDENNVDVEFEMAQVTENTLYFQALSNFWQKKMTGIKTVIEGRL